MMLIVSHYPKQLMELVKNLISIFGIIIGTGFGGALSYKKEIIEGSNQIAGD